MRFVATLLAVPMIAMTPHASLPAQELAVAQTAVTELAPAEAWEADPTLILEAAGVELDDFLWLARPVLVFADTPEDPAFIQQIELLRERPEALAMRDVVVITDTDPDAPSDARLMLRPRGFMLVLIGKDGQVEIRKPLPWDVRELTRSIDKMPMRRQEIRDGSRPGG